VIFVSSGIPHAVRSFMLKGESGASPWPVLGPEQDWSTFQAQDTQKGGALRGSRTTCTSPQMSQTYLRHCFTYPHTHTHTHTHKGLSFTLEM
jgi:hypothetical protein